MADLKIVITGDASGYEASLKNAEKATDGLEISLSEIAKTAAIAFAGLTATIGFSVLNFNDAKKSANELTLALQNQGIYTDDLNKQYKQFATTIADKTGLDDDAIIKAQAVAQSYLGQKAITQELTQAIVDLSVTMGGDLNGAAEKIGRTIGTSTNAFARQGLVLSDTASAAQRYQTTIDFVRNKTAGLAEQANNSSGGFIGLKTAIGDLSENVGERFSPIVSAATGALTNLIRGAKDNDAFIGLAGGILASGTALTGLVSTGAGAISVIANITTALKAMEITINLTKIAVIGLAGATGIGLLVVTLGLLGAAFLDNSKQLENFKKNLPGAREEIKRLQDQINELDKNGPRVGDGSLRVEVQAQKAALQQRIDNIRESTKEEMAAEEELLAAKKVAADKEAAIRADQLEREQRAQAFKTANIIAETKNESAATLALRKQLADNLASQASTQNRDEIAALQNQFTQRAAILEQQQTEDLERHRQFVQLQNEADQNNQISNSPENFASLRADEIAALQAQVQTRVEVQKAGAQAEMTARIQANNAYLANEQKFGKTYAAVKKAQSDEVYQGAKAGLEGLADLQESSNGTLKTIGKAAAIANIGIKTAESAMNIYAGFSTIPFIGPALGTAAAAAAIAFGAEQAGKVAGFAQGGIVTGGRAGMDSVPAMLMPGEIVTPKASFNETIGSVRAAREAKKFGSDNADVVNAIAGLADRLDNIGSSSVINVQGDVLADDAYIERFTEKLGDYLQFRNGRLRGVNA